MKGVEQKMEDLNVQIILPKVSVSNKFSFKIASDVGSSGTRSCTFDSTDFSNVSEILDIESAYTECTNNLDRFPSSSKNVIDNLQFIIDDITPNKDSKMFSNTQILKGSLMNQVTMQRERVTASESKIETQVTYTNILCSIALRALLLSSTEDEAIGKLDVDLTVALRPRDTATQIRCNYFKDRMSGIYTIELPRLNYKVEVTIHRDNIYLEDEASALLRYWATASEGIDVSKIKNAMVVDCGGSSTDIGVFRNGVIYREASQSYPYAGSNIETLINNNLQSEHGLSLLDKDEMLDVLNLGYALSCKDFSAVNAIQSAKADLCKRLINYINERLTVSETQIKAMEYIICNGKAFRESGVEDTDYYVPSVIEPLEDYIKSQSPRTEVTYLGNDYAILYGLIFYRISE